MPKGLFSPLTEPLFRLTTTYHWNWFYLLSADLEFTTPTFLLPSATTVTLSTLLVAHIVVVCPKILQLLQFDDIHS